MKPHRKWFIGVVPLMALAMLSLAGSQFIAPNQAEAACRTSRASIAEARAYTGGRYSFCTKSSCDDGSQYLICGGGLWGWIF